MSKKQSHVDPSVSSSTSPPLAPRASLIPPRGLRIADVAAKKRLGVEINEDDKGWSLPANNEQGEQAKPVNLEQVN